ncbi:MAG: MobF family relaxase [Hyphomicrobiaceae bacterium]|nr:MobF family relaxase [Hyphomicrobiaceae bacterium]
MVASISARGGVQAALGYYGHLGRDDYYTRGAEPPGRWAGEGSARLSLSGPVTRSEFDAALRGIDPKTGERIAQLGGRAQQHAAGWDMTFSAPKSVSVLWALSEPRDRPAIERAQAAAVTTATRHLERHAAWARRGKGGAIREQTAGLLMAKFDHHTSRELDPQLHTHVFVFNLAPRRDGTWGAIVSRELYKAQKQAGAVYREALANELERSGHAIERLPNSGFRIAAIPRSVERQFSKRRDVIEKAAALHGYHTPAGMELAALRTRQAKRAEPREHLFETWRAEAHEIGFALDQNRELIRGTAVTRSLDRSPPTAAETFVTSASQMSRAARQLDGNSSMPGVAIDLRNHEPARRRTEERER